MTRPMRCAAGIAGVLFFLGVSNVWSDPGREAWQHPDMGLRGKTAAIQAFQSAYPGVSFSERADRIRRVYGRAFSQGQTAEQSAESFRLANAAVFGVEAGELAAVGPFPDGRHVQPIMYDAQTGSYKFTGCYYTQQRDGIPVFRSALKLLVRNEPGYPLVLASADLRALGGFQVDARVAVEAPRAVSMQTALVRAGELTTADGEPQLISTRRVIWAGVDDDIAIAPKLADESLVGIDYDRWLILTDAETGGVLFEEHQIYDVDVVGTVEGLATEGPGAEQCQVEVPMPLPYLLVTTGQGIGVTDELGNFVIPNAGTDPVTVSTSLDGQWFNVINFQGSETTESVVVTPPGPADLLFNSGNTQFVRAQVNGYVSANRIRDYVLQFNPAYPALSQTGFAVNVNRTDGVCPANGWYDGVSINLCASSGSFPNTAWSSVIYHEYGHHLVQVGGSGQCQYGEGMGDVMSVILLDDPRVGLGFFGSCSGSLRNANNNCQYSPTSCTTNCGGPCHNCGRLLSGCVWSTRNELIVTEPVEYLNIISSLAINSILLHNGSSITPDIAIDFLTLDDDDTDICNGTPHSAEIIAGFSAHGMFAENIGFTFPGGLPDSVDPAGGTVVPVTITCASADPAPGTGMFFVDTGAGFVGTPMTELEPNVYEAIFPESDCGNQVPYFFTAETEGGDEILWPVGAPAETFVAISAASLTIPFADDFEADLSWSVLNFGGLTDGPWVRGNPAPNAGCQGSAPADADGTGKCYVTDIDLSTCNNDVDGGSTMLTSPVMNATGGLPIISYWRWYSNSTGNNPFQDIFEVEVSDDGGASWVDLETVGPGGPEVSGGWFFKNFPVLDFVDATTQFRIRFTASDADPGSRVEAGVDGVQLLILNCGGAVFGDLDGDGLVGINDFLILLASWGPCQGACPPSCPADLDGDCAVGINDFLLLLSNWSS